jgi:hypothetical protein
MPEPYDHSRIPDANEIISAILPGARIVLSRNPRERWPGLFIPKGSGPMVLARDGLPSPEDNFIVPLILGARGDRLSLKRADIRFSGTQEAAIAQVVRFLMDRRRYSMTWWGWKFGTDHPVYDLLMETSYLDRDRCECVRCGDYRATDWWSGRPRTGPCCTFAACRPVARDGYGNVDGVYGENVGGAGSGEGEDI